MGLVQSTINKAIGMVSGMAIAKKVYQDKQVAEQAKERVLKMKEARQAQSDALKARRQKLEERKLELAEYKAKTERGKLNLARKKQRGESIGSEQTVKLGNERIKIADLPKPLQDQLKGVK